jgi:hypothetical protein
MPYRLARLSLAESISEIAAFMRIKAGFYKEEMDYDANYTKLIEAQITVNEKLDAVREQLFKNPKIIQENSQEGRLLLVIFVDMVDLYEQIMSTFYNYQKLHKQFDHTGVLVDFEHILNLLSEHIDEISESLKDGSQPEFNQLLTRKLHTLRTKIDTFSIEDKSISLPLYHRIFRLHNTETWLIAMNSFPQFTFKPLQGVINTGVLNNATRYVWL